MRIAFGAALACFIICAAGIYWLHNAVTGIYDMGNLIGAAMAQGAQAKQVEPVICRPAKSVHDRIEDGFYWAPNPKKLVIRAVTPTKRQTPNPWHQYPIG